MVKKRGDKRETEEKFSQPPGKIREIFIDP
jgi:hypothetical protein